MAGACTVYMHASGTGDSREKHPVTGEVEIFSHRILDLGMPAHKRISLSGSTMS